jgi:exopolysaccharide biosynthesis polyprenyl glycosylphosphotransferase
MAAGSPTLQADRTGRAPLTGAPLTVLCPPDRALAERDGADAVVVRDRRFRRGLVAADLAAAALAGLVAVQLAGLEPTAFAVLLLPVVVLAAKLQGLYERDELLVHKTTLDEVPRVVQLAGIHLVAAWALDGLLFGDPLTKAQGLLLFGVLAAAGPAFRWLARAGARRVTARERLLLVGDEATHRRIHDRLRTHRLPCVLVGRLDTANRDGVAALGDEGLAHLVRDLDVHRLLVVPDEHNPAATLELVRAAKATGTRVSLVPRVLDVVGSAVVFDHPSGMFLLGVRRFGLTRSSRALKRAVDLAGAGLLLLAAAPVLLVAAVAIRLDSPGPVLFGQTRVGRDGRRFRIWKLRTMVRDAEARKDELRALAGPGLFKLDDDPRVTRVGRVLRRTNLDELPQLLNVLRGEMSLVGPRPLVLDEDRAITGHDRFRLQLKPGMTGPWQVLPDERVPLAEMVKIDVLYAGCWSVWTDVKLLLRTIPHVLARRGR